MRMFKLGSIIVVGAIAALGLAPEALAFHDGGVAYCEGCHTMHNSQNNVALNNHRPVNNGVPYLLKGSDQSSTCLNCHSGPTQSSYHVMTYPIPSTGIPPANESPGGDFAYLQKNYPLPAGSHGAAVAKQRHGHNINAVDYGLVPDPDITYAPGGIYSNANLSCISCHDPHSNLRITPAGLDGTIRGGTPHSTLPIGGAGSYGAAPDAEEAVGVYRLLGGVGYKPLSYAGGPSFTSDPPVAVAPATYNRSEAVTDTRVAYGSGMAEWCANCHVDIHTSVGSGQSAPFIHPAGATAYLNQTANIAGYTTTNAAIYNAYVNSGNLGGNQATSYLSLVPYEEGVGLAGRATLAAHAVNDGSYTAGPSTGSENVMCLSCHRAHATAFSSMTRWAPNTEFITIDSQWPGTDTGNAEAISYSNGMTQVEYARAMYDQSASKFAFKQRVLCNKCHAKD